MINTTIIGNVTKTPELRTVNTANGPVSVISLDIASNGSRKADGSTDTTFVRATAWRGLADMLAKYVTKGMKVVVTSTDLKAGAYVNKNGEAVGSLECTIQNFEFASSRSQTNTATTPTAEPVAEPAVQNTDDDDLPF